MNTGFLAMQVGRNFVARGLFLLLGFCVANTALAQELDAGQQLLHAFIHDVESLSARFEQSLIDANDDVLETASGTVHIRRPGRFRWTYSQPYEQHLVADGLNVWSYDVDLAQVTVRPQAEVLRNTPALLLGGADNVLDDFDYMGSFEDRGTVWVRLKPANSDHGFSEVKLGFTDGTLSRMMFDDTLGQTTLIALLDVTINERQADEFFVFVLPDDVDLVGVPVVAVPDSAADR